MICYRLYRGSNWQQEHYESSTRDARKRAARLRSLGFNVTVSALGHQVTNVGLVRMSMITIHNLAAQEVPAPEKLGRI